MIQQWLIASYPWSVAATWVSDDFSGGSIDTSKWTTHITTSGTISVASSELQLTRPASGTYNYMDSVSTQNSQIIFAQAYVSWDTNSADEDIVWFILTSASTPVHGNWYTYWAWITSRSNWWQYNIKTRNSGAVYNLDSTVTKWKEVKITYNTADNNIKFWYWDTSVWTQIWTTQTLDIKNWWNIKLIVYYDYISQTVGTWHIDNLYFGRISADYSTQYPV